MTRIRTVNAVCILFLFLFSGCLSVKSVSVGKVQDFNMEDFSDGEIKFSLKAKVENPNNFKIHITKVKLNAMLGNKLIGKVKHVNRVSIPANSEELIEIKATVKLAEEYNNLMDLAQLSMNKSSVKFNGYIKVRSFFFSKKIHVEDKNIMKLLNY